MIPKQTYKLISVSKFGMFEANPTTCDDCGRAICNVAVIEGLQDGKRYTVGLTCVKKLLKQTITFETEDAWELERQEHLFNQAMQSREWLDKKLKEYADRITSVKVYEFDSKITGTRMFYVEALGKHWGKDNFPLFTTGAMELRFKPFFKEFEGQEANAAESFK